MRAGKLNKQVTILKYTPATNPHSEPLETFTAAGVRWASVAPLNGREYWQASGENSEVTTRIRLRYDCLTSTITAQDRIRYEGKEQLIVSPPIDPDEKHREIVLMCKLNDRII